MLRYKFRSWDKEDECMSYGYYIVDHGTLNLFDFLGGVSSKLVVMQFTGLCDKNNNEIWEGDIIKYPDNNWGYGGDYDTEHDGFICVAVPSINEMIGDACWLMLKESEVVGNKYENPEFLEYLTIV